MRISELDGARVALWGAGREAAAAYRALATLASPPEVLVITDGPASASERARFTGTTAPRFLEGSEGLAALAGVDAVIRSPGVSRYRREARELERAGTPITTGTNLWLGEHREDPILMVTGTKGKSTTSALIAHLARHGGGQVVLAGNIGSPLLDHLAPAAAPELWVVELSSYQAADLQCSPRAAVVLNLHPEHLDWHETHERYFADKLNVLRDRERVLAILNGRDRRLRELDPPTHTTWFGTPGGYDTEGTSVTLGGTTVLAPDDSPLAGEHNALNVCAALTALAVLERRVEDPAAALRGFEALPHRLQTVRTVGSLRYVNDSISTTPEATMAALGALAGERVALIAGGFERDQDYGELARVIAATAIHAVIALPDTGARLLADVGLHLDTATVPHPLLIEADSIEDAVRRAREVLDGAGVVLLSPAAPSYGAFRDFEERGERFERAIDAHHSRPRLAT